MNKDNFDAWLEELRTTDKKQGKQYLKQYKSLDGDDARYCCLGIGCELAGLEQDATVDFGPVRFAGYNTLAPREFVLWLGLPEPEEHEVDIYPDWPEGLKGADGGWLHDNASAAGMNDSGFTFAQIADVFAYFGLKEDQ